MADETVDPKAEMVATHKIERDYYLGKTDIVPGTGGRTIAEVRKEYRAGVEKADADLEKDMERYRNVETPAEAPDPQTSITELPDGNALAALGKNDLVEQAGKEGLNVDGTATKGEIIQQIMAHRSGDNPA